MWHSPVGVARRLARRHVGRRRSAGWERGLGGRRSTHEMEECGLCCEVCLSVPPWNVSSAGGTSAEWRLARRRRGSGRGAAPAAPGRRTEAVLGGTGRGGWCAAAAAAPGGRRRLGRRRRARGQREARNGRDMRHDNYYYTARRLLLLRDRRAGPPHGEPTGVPARHPHHLSTPTKLDTPYSL